jgi:glutathione synthase/RimK-type ligase-like ATP-grasp enzyme
LRTPWDYIDHVTGFRAWVTHVANVSHLRNGADVVRWNLDKRYLFELARHGVPIVPTELAALADKADPERYLNDFAKRHRTQEIIIKPTVGINANGAMRALAHDPALAPHLSALLQTGGALVQPFVPAILTSGEVSLVFLGSRFSHAVRKLPRDGDFRVQDNHGGSVQPYTPSAKEIETACAALSVAPSPTTYARIDLVDLQGTLAVMELELIEPELYLRFFPAASDTFARQLVLELDGLDKYSKASSASRRNCSSNPAS